MGNCTIIHVAYADDLTLLSSTSTGMQNLINVCEKYAVKWRFRYNPQKTHAMLVTANGKTCFVNTPQLSMYNMDIAFCDDMTVLGCTFNRKGNAKTHMNVDWLRQGKHFIPYVIRVSLLHTLLVPPKLIFTKVYAKVFYCTALLPWDIIPKTLLAWKNFKEI